MKLLDNEITDINGYLYKMKKSMLDKMFFMDKVFEPFRCIVDFGCANGELIKTIQTLFPEYEYIGYDINPEMLEIAKKNVPSALFVSSLNELDIRFDDCLLNISSTIHEVYSYSTDGEIEDFWNRVFNSGYKYITIRDIMLSKKNNYVVDSKQLDAVRANPVYASNLRDFEAVWGKIKTNNELVHYLLKYSYTQNWERELRENYIALPVEDFFKRIPDSYEITYFEHFTLPYNKWQINKDFGIELNTPTHIKIVLKKT